MARKAARKTCKPRHEHDFVPGRSGSVEVCRCGAFRFTEKYLKENPAIVEVR